jgi:hypothetical protein
MRQRTDPHVRGRKNCPQGLAAAVLIGCCLVSSSILVAQEGYVGAKVCASCHPEEYKSQSQSSHANTLHPASTISRLEVPGGGAVESSDINAAHFEFRKGSDEYSVTVTLGKDQKQIPINWVFGAADQGYTFLSLVSKGHFLEHRLSYYKRKGGFDITPGQGPNTSESLEQALGVPVSSAEAFRCFECHSTYVKQTPDGPDLSSVVPGVTCERCHGPGAAHVNAILSRASDRRILNPGKLSGDELLSLCGECHRTDPPAGVLFDDPIVTRFQPIGLQMSACFQKSNGAITCTTCHNPHQNARRSADGFYEQRCLDCHNRPSARRCRVQPQGGCVGCHMVKTTLFRYMSFTDHWIRVRPGPSAR